MTIETFDPTVDTGAPVQVTAAAQAHFARQLANAGKTALRLSLKNAGCTGFKYVIEEIDTPPAAHIRQDLDNGIALYVEHANLAGLKDLLIDYRQQGLNQNLVLDNPNVKDACGCGESFNF